MLTMTLEQGQQIFLKALAGNNFSAESIRAYNADITQFLEFLKSVRVDWNKPRHDLRYPSVHFSRPYPVRTDSNSTNCCVATDLCPCRRRVRGRYNTKDSWGVSGMSAPGGEAKRVG